MRSFICSVGANSLWLPKSAKCAIKSRPGSSKQGSPTKMTLMSSHMPGTKTFWEWLNSARMSQQQSLCLQSCFKCFPTCTIPTCSKRKNQSSSGKRTGTWKTTLTTCWQSSRRPTRTYIFLNLKVVKVKQRSTRDLQGARQNLGPLEIFCWLTDGLKRLAGWAIVRCQEKEIRRAEQEDQDAGLLQGHEDWFYQEDQESSGGATEHQAKKTEGNRTVLWPGQFWRIRLNWLQGRRWLHLQLWRIAQAQGKRLLPVSSLARDHCTNRRALKVAGTALQRPAQKAVRLSQSLPLIQWCDCRQSQVCGHSQSLWRWLRTLAHLLHRPQRIN